ncbi:MAG: DUF3857 domain-containing protein [Thermoanaerobaculia bacterium]|nr:DUF3857 domain-containing protein [Thermoanaerobaculia bacterium]
MHFLRLPLFVLLLLPCMLPAQTSGWDFIRENNFVQARPAFEAALAQNPNDEAVLLGLIFLAETIRDHESYEKYANQLLDAHWTPEYVWLFQHLFKGTPEEALRRAAGNSTLSAWAQQQADTLFKYRRFAESAALRTSILPDWNWSVCGPFTNIAGSGFVEAAPPETRSFSWQDSFLNDQKIPLRWLRRLQRKPGAPVGFDDLPQNGEPGVWYANTFIDVPTARGVALRVSSAEPVKVWLDDRILFERSRPVAAGEWDQEILLFELPAGKHRLLVKIAGFPKEYAGSRIRLEFNDLGNNGDYDYEPQYEGLADNAPPALEAQSVFALRFTDPATGAAFPDVVSAWEAPYQPASRPWNAVVEENRHLQTLQAAWQAHPRALWRLYLVAKAFAKYEAWEEGEAFFAGLPSGTAFQRFLLAKFYDANGKSERAEALLSEMDTSLAPTYAEHYLRLQKIDPEQDEAQYLAALEHLLQLSPTNWTLLNRYLSFLKEKGRQEQARAFSRRFLEQHDSPKWKKRLKSYLEAESYKPSSFKQETDREREKKYRAARQRLKTMFSLPDYGTVIRYLKQKDKTEETLRTYDEILSAAPWLKYYQRQKAAYLFEKERPGEALQLIRELLDIQPYDAALCELAGDIYIEKKQEKEALSWYKKARLFKGREGYDLAGKIEKLENRRSYAVYFNAVDLNALAKSSGVPEIFAGEEAVITYLGHQLAYIPEERKYQAAHKCVIHIRNEAGAKRWTEADLSMLGKVTSARVVKQDGTVSSPDLGWGGMAVFKNLQAGDVILLEGSSERGAPEEFGDDLLGLEFLSWPAPVLRATFELLLPAQQELYFAFNRLSEQHTRRDTGAFKLLRWEWNNIPKIEEEEAMPENIDASAWIMYGGAPDWSRVVQWYQRKTYCRTEPNYEVLAKARDLVQTGMSEQQIVTTLHNFITKEINYSYVPFLNSNYIPKKPGATLSAKVGDCKDVASLMIAMLREQGIPAWYTLVSTHSFSNTEPRPTPYVFNHAIVAYQTSDGRLHFDDLTTDYFPSGVLPDSDSDAWGLIIRDGETQLRRLPDHLLDPAVSGVGIRAEATLDSMGNLVMNAAVECRGVAAGNWRETLLRSTPEERLKRLTDYFGGGVLSHLDIGSARFDNLDSINAPLIAQIQTTAFHQMDQVAGLYILPLPLPLSTPTIKALFVARRYNNLDAQAFFEISPVRETVDLYFPPGITLAEAPRPVSLDTRFGRYSLLCEAIPGGLRIRREVRFTQRFISHADFPAFRQFYLDMLEADDGLLALRR